MDAAGVGKRAIAIAGILLLLGVPTCFYGVTSMFSYGSPALLGEPALFAGIAMLAASAVALVVAVAAFIAWLVKRP